jgi:hypothetical protein
MSVIDVEAAVRRITNTTNFICFIGKNGIPSKITFSVSTHFLTHNACNQLCCQVSSDRQMLEFKKGKLSVNSEQINFGDLDMTFDRIEGYPNDSRPAQVIRHHFRHIPML